MKANRWLLAGLVVLAIAVIAGGRWLWREEGAGLVVADATAPAQNTNAIRLPPGEVPASSPPAIDTPLPALPEAGVDAAASMAQALEHGDPQAPAVVRDTGPHEQATPAELADPAAYRRYQSRQNQRLYKQFVQAADAEIPKLQADIERARQAGLTPAQLAEGEEKLRRIQAMRDQLQADHPELNAPAP